jgi:hypothetical protein
MNGALFDPGDDAGLAARITELAQHPALISTLSAGALASAKRYLPEQIVSEFNAVFAGLIPVSTARPHFSIGEAKL